ncbi:Ank3 [Symbiodinium necroappetens]|uniref:Ank3 protein n=1 Tax=Symbiodinium necroappetens TaxID=1628268 RepID=A0A812M272_9DINO|nr:Ank3 [Symbiodinium necroappetens]
MVEDVLEDPRPDPKEKLLVAVAAGKEEEVATLLGSMAPSAEALVLAARRDEFGVVQLLLEKRASANAPDRFGWTPLVVAAAKGHFFLVEQLLECQATPDPKTGPGKKRVVTALHAAASFAKFDGLPSRDLQAKEEAAKETSEAIKYLDMASTLLQKQADPNVCLEWEGHEPITCLLAAASSKAQDSYVLDMIHLLLMERADPEAAKDGHTVLSVAAEADAEGRRAEYLLDRLLRGEGREYTDLVQNLLQEVQPAKGYTRQQRLRESVRTILGRENGKQVKQKVSLLSRKSTKSTGKDVQPKATNDWDLELQNLQYAPKVQVSLRTLPIQAPLACRPGVLRALAETANDETLASDTVEAITAAAWLQLRAVTAIDVCLDAMAVACLCSVTISCRTGGDGRAQLPFFFLILIQVKEATEWIVHFFYVFGGFFANLVSHNFLMTTVESEDWEDSISAQGAEVLETFADLLFLVVGWLAIASQMHLCSENKMDKVWMPWFCSMYWLRFVYSLRGERWLGIYLLPILSAVRDTWAFFFVTFLCVGGATHAYVILGPRGEDPLPIYSALTHTVRLAIFGDFDLFEYQGQDTNYALNTETNEWEPKDPSPRDLGADWFWSYSYLQLFFFITGMGITVLLMNLLIGILSTNYDTHQGRAQILFVQARACMLLEQQRRPWSMAFAWLRRGFKNPATYSAARIKTGRLEEDFGGLPEQYRYPANVGIVALYPLQQVMTRDIFRHFLAGAVYGPVLQHPHLAFVILILSPLLLVLSLLVWLTFGLLCLVFRWQGVRYAINLTVFGIFNTQFASECHILALIRKEDGKTDQKERFEKLEVYLKELCRGHQGSDGKLDKMLALLDDGWQGTQGKKKATKPRKQAEAPQSTGGLSNIPKEELPLPPPSKETEAPAKPCAEVLRTGPGAGTKSLEELIGWNAELMQQYCQLMADVSTYIRQIQASRPGLLENLPFQPIWMDPVPVHEPTAENLRKSISESFLHVAWKPAARDP